MRNTEEDGEIYSRTFAAPNEISISDRKRKSANQLRTAFEEFQVPPSLWDLEFVYLREAKADWLPNATNGEITRQEGLKFQTPASSLAGGERCNSCQEERREVSVA